MNTCQGGVLSTTQDTKNAIVENVESDEGL